MDNNGRRAALLYATGDLFACRRCCDLAYASQQKNALLRNVSRSQKKRMRLGGSPDPFERNKTDSVMPLQTMGL
jgi:hypothetical protein